MTDWQPIETCPFVEDEEVVVFENGRIYIASFWSGLPPPKAWWVLNEFTVEPTHWMPLPEFPYDWSPPPKIHKRRKGLPSPANKMEK